MHEPWQDLRVGDRIRIVRMPSDFSQPGFYASRGTRRLYKRLIARRSPLRICEIDEWDLPWIRCRFRRNYDSWEHHSLAIIDDSWVRVKSRNPP